MLGQFMQDLGKRQDDIERGLAEGRLADVAKVAHGLKGVAGTLGLKALYRVAAELDQAARAQDRDAAKARQALLTETARRTREVMSGRI